LHGSHPRFGFSSAKALYLRFPSSGATPREDLHYCRAPPRNAAVSAKDDRHIVHSVSEERYSLCSNDFHYRSIITQGRVNVTRLDEDFLYKFLNKFKHEFGIFLSRDSGTISGMISEQLSGGISAQFSGRISALPLNVTIFSRTTSGNQ